MVADTQAVGGGAFMLVSCEQSQRNPIYLYYVCCRIYSKIKCLKKGYSMQLLLCRLALENSANVRQNKCLNRYFVEIFLKSWFCGPFFTLILTMYIHKLASFFGSMQKRIVSIDCRKVQGGRQEFQIGVPFLSTWAFRPLGFQVFGPLGLQVLGLLVFRSSGLWVFRLSGLSAFGSLGIWTFGFSDLLAFGPMG